MWIHAKIGTGPMSRVKVLRKRKAPKVGDRLWIRPLDAWEDIPVIVTEIKDVGHPLYLLERM